MTRLAFVAFSGSLFLFRDCLLSHKVASRLLKKWLWAFLSLAILPTTNFVDAAPLETNVTKIRTWAHSDYTRFVMELSSQIEPEIFVISNPYRLVIDLPEVKFLLPMEAQEVVGLIKNYRFGLFEPGISRLVIDLTGPSAIKKSFVLAPTDQKPYRIVLDLIATTEKQFLKTAANRRDNKTPSLKTPPAPTVTAHDNPNSNFTIVLDPGHGGVDPGAIGENGFYEKTVALSAAQELAVALKTLGTYKVVLTRNADVFIPLRERVSLARKVGGNLFISIHADSIKNRDIRGGHVYTLSEKASDKEAQALAEKENQADVIAGFDLEEHPPDVSSILLSLAQRETNNSSARVANTIVEEWRNRGLTLLRKPHRQAGFAVLKAPDIPSVLVELGFLSNSQESALLSNKSSRQPLINALAQSIHIYVENLNK